MSEVNDVLGIPDLFKMVTGGFESNVSATISRAREARGKRIEIAKSFRNSAIRARAIGNSGL